jgi:hypothetical protein
MKSSSWNCPGVQLSENIPRREAIASEGRKWRKNSDFATR